MKRLMKVGVYWLVCLPDSGGTGLDACAKVRLSIKWMISGLYTQDF